MRYVTSRGVKLLLDNAYKLGVTDALEYRDALAAETFIEKLRMPGVFGTLRVGYTDWRSFSAIISSEMTGKQCYRLCAEWLFNIRGFNQDYRCVIVIMMQEFYIKGVEDYYKNPVKQLYDSFMEKIHMIWHLRCLRKSADYINEMQMVIINRMKVQNEYDEYKDPANKRFNIKPEFYREFMVMAWNR